MALLYKKIWIFVVTATCLTVHCEQKNITSHKSLSLSVKEEKQKKIKVKVLLADCSQADDNTWKFVCPEGFYIGSVSGTMRRKKTRLHELQVLIKKDVVYLNGKKITDDFYISPVAGYAEYEGVAYDGDFFIQKHKNNIMCINSVELEDYLCAVLRTESWPGWPLEVNLVFAIASRSYVVSKILEAKKTNSPYHVKNSNVHQTYQGRHTVKQLRDAVEQTRGIVLAFDGTPILAMFDCCCGGVIPAYIDDFNFIQAPYLARTYPCTYCKQCSLYAWSIVYDQHIFEETLYEALGKVGRLHDVAVSKKDKAGLVKEIKVRMSGAHQIISGKKMYSLFKDVKSFYFTVSKKGKKVIFNGRGFGHHLGLCQWGAREMVKQGRDYVSILQFYYPGTTFMKLA